MKTPLELNSANRASRGKKPSVFTQTGAFILFFIVIAVVNVSHFIAGYEQRQTLSALQAKIKANQTMIDASQTRIAGSQTRLDRMKRQLDNIKRPGDGRQ